MAQSRIILVRHAQSLHHVDQLAPGHPDEANGLTDIGRQQACALARRLKADLGDDACLLFTSNLRRSLETAQIIAQGLGVEPTASAELREVWNRPVSAAARAARDAAAQEFSLFDWRPCEGEETWRQFHARVSEYVDDLIVRADRLPIIVTHGGTLSTIVTWWLGLPLDVLPERDPFRSSPGSLTVLSTNRFGHRVLACLNDTAHLLRQR